MNRSDDAIRLYERLHERNPRLDARGQQPRDAARHVQQGSGEPGSRARSERPFATSGSGSLSRYPRLGALQARRDRAGAACVGACGCRFTRFEGRAIPSRPGASQSWRARQGARVPRRIAVSGPLRRGARARPGLDARDHHGLDHELADLLGAGLPFHHDLRDCGESSLLRAGHGPSGRIPAGLGGFLPALRAARLGIVEALRAS